MSPPTINDLAAALLDMRQQLGGLRAETDRLSDQLFVTINQLGLLVLAIKQADFRMRGFNPLMDALDLLHRNLLTQLDADRAQHDQRLIDQTQALLDACERLHARLFD